MKPILFPLGAFLSIAVTALFVAPRAHANVFASDIRINSGFTNVVAAPGESVEISYILNEIATLGVNVDIMNGATVVRRFSLPAQSPGTQSGTNSLIWDLRDNSSNTVAGATYSINITAAAEGYTNWTQISSDSDPNTFVNEGRGVASVQQPGNPYFGRTIVANARGGSESLPGYALGLWKFNADQSSPEDGITSTAGRTWSGNGLGPWKVEAANDFVYANDLGLNGLVFRCDPTLSSNTLTAVMREDNLPVGAAFSGFALSGAATNDQLWMADHTSGFGIVKWRLGPDGTCMDADKGTTVIGVGTAPLSGLSLPPQDVALDREGNIYVCQYVVDQASPMNRVFRFRAYDPSTNGGLPAFTADWGVGAGDDTYGGASGISVDPTGTYVAVAFEGISALGLVFGGNTKVLYTTNGAVAANIDLGVVLQGLSDHQDTDCTWDAAGNLYYIDNYVGTWRVFSPPGTNHMSSIAPAAVVVSGSLTAPQITGISVSNGVTRILFTAGASDSTGDFVVLATSSLAAPFAVAQNASISSSGAGSFIASIPVSGSVQFYKIERRTTQPTQPQILTLTVNSGVVRIDFNGAPADSASAFTLLSSDSLAASFLPVQDAQFSGSGGAFQVTAPTNGPVRYYRIQR